MAEISQIIDELEKQGIREMVLREMLKNLVREPKEDILIYIGIANVAYQDRCKNEIAVLERLLGDGNK